MNSKEAEARSGMTRANIRYYEQEGLLRPARLENGYRDYSQEDLDTLARIRLLRQLGVPLEQIRDLQSGAASLPQVAAAQAETLAAGAQAAQEAIEICRAICEDGVEYAALDAALYENGPRRIPAQQAQEEDFWAGAAGRENVRRAQDADRPVYLGAQAVQPQQPELPPVRSPLRRYGAVRFDGVLRFFLLAAALCALSRAGLPWPKAGAPEQAFQAAVLLGVAAWLTGFFAEPALLHWFGTTPGKAVFGLAIRCADGSRPTFRQAQERTAARAWSRWRVTSWWGGAPELRRIWDEAQNGTPNDWQIPGEVYTQKDESGWRCAACGAGIALMLGLSVLWLGDAAALPRLRGAPTGAQLAANYNGSSADGADENGWWKLEPDGSWTLKEGCRVTGYGMEYTSPSGVVSVYHRPLGVTPPSPLELTQTDGAVTAVRWESRSEGSLCLYEDLFFAQRLAWSYAGAQWGLHFWDLRPLEALDRWMPYSQDTSFVLGKVALHIELETLGPASEEVREEYGEQERQYRLTLTMEKEQ